MPASTSPAYRAGFVSPWLARKDADWWIDELYDFAAALGATVVRTSLSRTVIDVNRDPSRRLALSRPGDDRALPDHDLRRRAALSRAARRRTRPRSPSGARVYFEPYHAALAAEIERLRDVHGASCSTMPIRSARASRACSRASCRMFNIGTNGGASCDPDLRRAVEARLRRASATAAVINGRFKGGWITRALRRARRGRARDPDGACLPRLYAEPERTGRRTTGRRPSTTLRRADARHARTTFWKRPAWTSRTYRHRERQPMTA